jgi:energy-coupling factor transporter ATP-binding protein EcfA2
MLASPPPGKLPGNKLRSDGKERGRLMLTRLKVRNFKRFEEVEIELGETVVLIGPNNSGKTAALQALALWDIGVKRWNEKRGGRQPAAKRPGVTINRRDLIGVPVPDANLLWRNLHVRDVQRTNGKMQTNNVRVDIIVEGITEDKEWVCGLEFDYANEESFYCRPLRTAEGENLARMPVPAAVSDVRVAFLPPMSGLAANETRLDQGAINVRLGEGRTADVLRNICYQIATAERGDGWLKVCRQTEMLFGVRLDEPLYVQERGEISMSYRNPDGVRLDLSTSGRGLQQTLLLLAYLEANPGAVLLLDEPDAHLEILRQRQIYQLLTDAARQSDSQIIAASHSEVILNEAADRDVVVAFIGRPHRIDDRGHQLLKSLKEIGFDQFYLAEQTGWVLYLEGSTDLAILQAFAERLDHPAQEALKAPFVHYIMNRPNKAREHFRGLREAYRPLVGYTLCDRLETALQPTAELQERMWRRREIENYLCQPATLEAYATHLDPQDSEGSLFQWHRAAVMRECIADFVPAIALRDPDDSWWVNTKATDDFLDRLFEEFFKRLGIQNMMRKTDYHNLARYVPVDEISPEVSEVLDSILEVARRATPVR